jgi:hypothetical protein
MARAACCSLTNSQGSGSPPEGRESALSRLRGPFPSRGQPAQQLDPSQRGPGDARELSLARANAFREAAISLSLGGGVLFTGREYQLLERLWRIDP